MPSDNFSDHLPPQQNERDPAFIFPSSAGNGVAAEPPRQQAVGPLWHTLLLVATIVGASAYGAMRQPIHSMGGSQIVRYASTAVLELVLVLWVALGLRLRRIPFRSLFGALPRSFKAVCLDVGIAAIFWFASMFILGSFSLTWVIIENRAYLHKVAQQAADKASGNSSASVEKPVSPQAKQMKMLRSFMKLVPSTSSEWIAWGLLCLVVGFSEELVFRGYLQSQGMALMHRIPIGILFSALIFGAAHGYEGLRGMCMIAIFGALFSILSLIRRSLVPGMIAHSWHDFFVVMMLAIVRSLHLLDKLPPPS